MSLYNKYRPASFDDLVQNKFNNKLTKEELTHHAYLFFGGAGTGKTSTARICMSQFVADKEKESVIAGKHPDYVEINCAVNNGVDDVRSIVSDIVATIPMTAKYKFIVLDESHQLTTQAQNALLKTVEEPPKHIKFFFCTTEVNKVIPTIRSRCQIVPFLKINDIGMKKILENVCKGEKYKYDIESLKLISSCAEGSGRAAINYLEQCSASLDDVNAVANILGTASDATFEQLTEAMCAKNRVKSLTLIEEILSNSVDPGSVFNKYADYIADQIILRLTKPKECKFEGKKLLIIADCVTDVLKDFKILQNIKLISKINVLKAVERI